MKMLSKGIWHAIREDQVMYWAIIPGTFVAELRAVTAVNENGTIRSKQLTTCDRPVDIRDLSKDIKTAGGLIDLDHVNLVCEGLDLDRWQREQDDKRGRS